ncbi:MAG TPA: hypothetical protein VLI43_04885, partial [Gemmatimonadaceae bacterium]|nr:hypothetical protein [Gemmatimonadaceae bacterium]
PPYLRDQVQRQLQLDPFEVAMIRRRIALIAVVLTSFALAACTSPTAPSQDCGVTVGSGCGPK